MKLNLSLAPIASTSAAADFLDADKHVNLGKAKTAGNKLAAAAAKFGAALAKQDPVATKIATKLGAKTARQIQKLTEPTTLYYVKKGTKPVPYSITKEKSGDTTYMRKRAIRIMSRKKATDAYDLVAAVYNEAVLDKVSKAIQRDLIKALQMHGVTSEKTKVAATGINQQRNDDESKAFAANMEALLGLLGEKVKPTSVFNYAPARGKPATYLTLPNKGVVVVRYADAAQLRAIKKKAADDAAKASTSSDWPDDEFVSESVTLKPRAAGPKTAPKAPERKKETPEERANRIARDKKNVAERKQREADHKDGRVAAIAKAKSAFAEVKAKIAKLRATIKSAGSHSQEAERCRKEIDLLRGKHNKDIETAVHKYGERGFASYKFERTYGGHGDGPRMKQKPRHR